MAETPQIASPRGAAQVPESAPGLKTPETKSTLAKDIFIPILTLALGSFLTVSGDVLKRRYELRSSAQRVRYVEDDEPPVKIGPTYIQDKSTIIRPVGAQIPITVVTATPNQNAQVIDEKITSEPERQQAKIQQIEDEGVRKLIIRDFHDPQRVTWMVRAESKIETDGSLVSFNYPKPADSRAEGGVGSWKEKFSPASVAVIFLVYSIIATIAALYYRSRARRRT